MGKVKLRVMGEPIDVQRFAEELAMRFAVVSQSVDYRNRRGDEGVRRYVEVEVSDDSRVNLTEDWELLPVRPEEIQ